MWKLLLLIPWTGAGMAAWWFVETNGSRIKKHDAALYDKLKNDKDGNEKKTLKDGLDTAKDEQKTDKDKLEDLKKKKDSELTQEVKDEIKKLEEEIAKRETEIKIVESLDSKMWMPVMSISNLAWGAGIFLGVGVVGHFIFKAIIKMFVGKGEEA